MKGQGTASRCGKTQAQSGFQADFKSYGHSGRLSLSIIPRRNSSEVDAMKISVLIICLLFCTTLAAGQSVVGVAALNSQPMPLQIYTNPQHASHQPMAEAQSLLQPSAYTHAQGERPLWEVAKFPDAVPLGDIARALREERAGARKSEVVWVNQ
jgi:hypothetical protein